MGFNQRAQGLPASGELPCWRNNQHVVHVNITLRQPGG